MRDAAAGRLELNTERRDGVIVVRAEGEVDLDTAEALDAALRSAGDAGGPVVLDLIGVPFMDSSGLKVLLLASERIGERLALTISPGSPVATLLEIAQVHDRFRIHPTPEDAIEASPGG